MSQKEIETRLKEFKAKLQLLSYIQDKSEEVKKRMKDLQIAIGLLEAIR